MTACPKHSSVPLCCVLLCLQEFDFQTGVGNNPATTFSVSNVLNNPFLVQTSGVGAAECTPWDTSMDTVLPIMFDIADVTYIRAPLGTPPRAS